MMKIKYNWEFDRYVTEDGKVFRYDSKQDKLVLCKSVPNRVSGYKQVRVSKPKRTMILVHRLVYETFIGKVKKGFELDHINTVRNDNSLENLRLCTHKENMNNPLTLKKRVGIKTTKGHTWACSEFGRKFKEHFGITCSENPKLYDRELKWYKYHNKKCRWESKK